MEPDAPDFETMLAWLMDSPYVYGFGVESENGQTEISTTVEVASPQGKEYHIRCEVTITATNIGAGLQALQEMVDAITGGTD